MLASIKDTFLVKSLILSSKKEYIGQISFRNVRDKCDLKILLSIFPNKLILLQLVDEFHVQLQI